MYSRESTLIQIRPYRNLFREICAGESEATPQRRNIAKPSSAGVRVFSRDKQHAHPHPALVPRQPQVRSCPNTFQTKSIHFWIAHGLGAPLVTIHLSTHAKLQHSRHITCFSLSPVPHDIHTLAQNVHSYPTYPYRGPTPGDPFVAFTSMVRARLGIVSCCRHVCSMAGKPHAELERVLHAQELVTPFTVALPPHFCVVQAFAIYLLLLYQKYPFGSKPNIIFCSWSKETYTMSACSLSSCVKIVSKRRHRVSSYVFGYKCH